jgi:Uma2 family endonuclease
MAAVTIFSPPEPPIYRFTVRQYHKMIQDGVLTEDDPVELLEGAIVFKMPKNTPRATCVRKCRRAIAPVLPTSCFYDAEQPITLSDGEPEPDGFVVAGTIEDYEHRHPESADLRLVVEVAESSLATDRAVKLRTYARAGIPCYWIVNLIDRQLEVYTQPDATAAVPIYRATRAFKPGEHVDLLIDGQTAGSIAVDDLLPAAS